TWVGALRVEARAARQDGSQCPRWRVRNGTVVRYDRGAGRGVANMWNAGRSEATVRSLQQESLSGVTTANLGWDTSQPTVGPAVRSLLERWIRASTTPQRVVRRSQIVLLTSMGL